MSGISSQHEIKINLPGLLRMLGRNIYAVPDVAVREMIQNAHDTSIIRKAEDPTFTDPEIRISFDGRARTLTIADSGAGMTEDELHTNLATIGKSFTRVRREELRGKDAQAASMLIGQFGLGLLSAFSVADHVELLTRSYLPDATGCRWVCEGDIHYTVEPFDKPDVGTQVVLHLLDSKLELLDEVRLRQAIKKYADFLSIPIFVHGKQMNAVTPPWEAKDGTVNLANYIEERWGLFPLGIISFDTGWGTDAEGRPIPQVSGLLFIPMIPSELVRDFGEVDVYVSRMFVKANDKDLLPRWARFVKGVINTPDLTPTLSRGELIANDAYHQIRALLGSAILAYLKDLERDDPEKLSLLVGAYNNVIKAHALEDKAFFDRICDLVRVSTDLGLITIGAYLQKSGGVIYYFAEAGSATQHKLLFAHKGLPAIDASWGMEEDFLRQYAVCKNIGIERLTAAAGTIFAVPETIDAKWRALEFDFTRVSKKDARAVEFEPDLIPAVLVAAPLDRDEKKLYEMDALGVQLGIRSTAIREIFKQLGKSKATRESSRDTVLHLNTKNLLMQQLREMPRNETFELAVTCVFYNAMMFAHHYVSPTDAEIIFRTNNAAFLKMTAAAHELASEQERREKVELERDQLQRRLSMAPLTEYRSCFFAFDYKVEDNFRLMKWLEDYFLRKSYGVRVLAPARHIDDLNLLKDLHKQLKTAHFGIAEVSNNNLNVLYEAGLLHGMDKSLILLQNRSSTDAVPFDIFSDYRVQYEISRRGAEVQFIWLEEELDKAMNAVLRMPPEFAQVPKWTG